MRYRKAMSASAAAAPTSNEMFQFGLSFPKGDDTIKGLTFSGSPPRIDSIAPGTKIELPSTTRGGPLSVLGYYFVALQVNCLEIYGVEEADHLQDLLQEFTQGRDYCLLLSSHPPPDATGRRVTTWLDDDNNQQNNSQDEYQIQCLYKYDLPAHQDLGVKVSNVPPQLTDLTPDSPLNQYICHLKYKTLLVHSILFPNQERADLTELSIGFDAKKIIDVLQATNNVSERQLVLKEVVPADAASRKRRNKRTAEVVLDENANHHENTSAWEGLCCW